MDVIKRRPLLERVDELKESIEKLTDIVTQSSGGMIEFSEKSADTLPRGRLQTKNIVSFRKLLETLKKKSKVVDIGSGMGRTIMSASDIIIEKELQVSCLDSWDSEEYAKLLQKKTNEKVRYRWMNDEEDQDDCYFEFKIVVDEITKDVSLIVSDFAEEDELDEAKMLWENAIGSLKQVLGAS